MTVELTDEQARQLMTCIVNCKYYHVDDAHCQTHRPLLELLTPKLAEPTKFGAQVTSSDGDVYTKSWFRNSKESISYLVWQSKNNKMHWSWDYIKNPVIIWEGN